LTLPQRLGDLFFLFCFGCCKFLFSLIFLFAFVEGQACSLYFILDQSSEGSGQTPNNWLIDKLDIFPFNRLMKKLNFL